MAVLHHELDNVGLGDYYGDYLGGVCSFAGSYCPTLEAAAIFGAFEWYVMTIRFYAPNAFGAENIMLRAGDRKVLQLTFFLSSGLSSPPPPSSRPWLRSVVIRASLQHLPPLRNYGLACLGAIRQAIVPPVFLRLHTMRLLSSKEHGVLGLNIVRSATIAFLYNLIGAHLSSFWGLNTTKLGYGLVSVSSTML